MGQVRNASIYIEQSTVTNGREKRMNMGFTGKIETCSDMSARRLNALGIAKRTRDDIDLIREWDELATIDERTNQMVTESHSMIRSAQRQIPHSIGTVDIQISIENQSHSLVFHRSTSLFFGLEPFIPGIQFIHMFIMCPSSSQSALKI